MNHDRLADTILLPADRTRRTTHRHRRLSGVVIAVLLGATSCGSDDAPSSGRAESAATSAGATTTPTTQTPATDGDGIAQHALTTDSAEGSIAARGHDMSADAAEHWIEADRWARVEACLRSYRTADMLERCIENDTFAVPDRNPAPTGSTAEPLDLKPVRSIDLGAEAWSAVYGFGGVWVQVDPPVDQLVKVDASSGEITLTIDRASSAVVEGDSMWITVDDETRKIDPYTGAVLAATSTPGAHYVTAGAGSLWAPDAEGVFRIDPATGVVLAKIPVDGGVKNLKATDDAVWISQKDAGRVVRIDPQSNSVVAQIPTADGAHGIAIDEHGVWITNYHANTVSRIDPLTNTVVATIPRVGSGVGIVAGDGEIYVSTQAKGISRIDPTTNKATLIASFGEWNYGVAYGGGALWVTSVNNGLLYQLLIPHG